jgi:hypothetical protein
VLSLIRREAELLKKVLRDLPADVFFACERRRLLGILEKLDAGLEATPLHSGNVR